MKVSVASCQPAPRVSEDDLAIASAYMGLYAVCRDRAEKAAAKGDVYDVYNWMKRAIAAEGMARRAERGHI